MRFWFLSEVRKLGEESALDVILIAWFERPRLPTKKSSVMIAAIT